MTVTVNATAITFNNGSVQTVAGGAGTVTSVATGNGLSGGTITSTGTLVIAAPGFNTVGSYSQVGAAGGSSFSSGGNYSAGAGASQMRSASQDSFYAGFILINNLSGTWRFMAASITDVGGAAIMGIACRVS